MATVGEVREYGGRFQDSNSGHVVCFWRESFSSLGIPAGGSTVLTYFFLLFLRIVLY